MKITRKILQNIIEEELESVLNEQDYLDKAKKMISKHPMAKGAKAIGKFAREFGSTQGPRYKSRAQAQAALDKAATPSTGLGQTVVDLQNKLADMADIRDQQLDSLAGRIQAIEKKLNLIKKKLGL